MGGKKVFELTLEIGYRSQPLKHKLPNDYTHKWTIFVRGADHAKIEHCIERVVFQLHDTFPNPNRVITEPPYQVKEIGYAGFEIPIEIYFKNRDKPNHVVFNLDLNLLLDGPLNSIKSEKVSFYHPHRDFEKCLIKAGAHMKMSKDKKERSYSPPAKKQKSFSLIPSKDMSKQAAQTNTQASNNANHHQSSAPSSSNSLPKPKTTSREFMDIFGAPIVVNNNNSNHNDIAATTTTSTSIGTTNNNHITASNNTTFSNSSGGSSSGSSNRVSSNHIHNNHNNTSTNHGVSSNASHSADSHLNSTINSLTNSKHHHSLNGSFQTIQDKIATLADCDRLQKIVDIIEESGEWFNLTATKFEFDLKRLDKKTLYRIEKCLNTLN